ncbi:MAG: glycosyltransferase family 4 protein, partial [Holophagales bacterium]|nr:glycosyltransferase family 4 protein [Holophagales bacterium]
GLGVRPPYLLILGSILQRRRLDLVLAGLTRLLGEPARAGVATAAGDLPVEELQLVVAGANQLPRPDDLDRMIRSSGCADRVIRIGYVDDRALPELYAGAVGTIYVSEYEGYGLPPLESLAAGVPALVSDAPALLELWPDYPLRCDRLDVDGVTDGLRRLLFDREARRVAEVQGPERVRSLTWARAAETFAIEVETAWRTARETRS